jgi:hypothetical protein
MQPKDRTLARVATAWAAGMALLSAGGTASAEIESLRLHLYGGLTQRSEWHIKYLLSRHVDPDDITFSTYVDDKGKKQPWHTVVEIKPGDDYVNVYQVMHRIRDTRGVEDGRMLFRTDVTATGDLRAHFGWTRSLFWLPAWVQARGLATSGLWHYLAVDDRGAGDRFLFHPNDKYDEMRLAPHQGEPVRIEGRITGFDGPYPVVVLGGSQSVRADEENVQEPEEEREERGRDRPQRPRQRLRRPQQRD